MWQGFDGAGCEDERLGGSEIVGAAEGHAHAPECPCVLKFLPVATAHDLADRSVTPVFDGLIPVPVRL